MAIKALQHLKPNNIKLVLTQEHLASEVLSELTLTHELKQLSSGECFLINNNGPGFKDQIICYTAQQNLMELKRASTWLVDSTFITFLWMFYQLWMINAQIDIWVIPLTFFIFPGATEAIYTCASFILFQELSLLPPNDDAKKTPPHMHPNPPDADKDQATLDLKEKVGLRALGPHICIMEFEPAQFNAFEQLFGMKVQGYHFYFHQAVACNVQENDDLSRLSWRNTLDTCIFVLTQFSV
ncbi:hypothetical protein DSO57_1036391 [Entomophthora muscae]|uniref:Uncharacterized protein n=1 Tax=Entomophthora muscae TaxID=34485 RepID=A0ACC2SZK2_9FUNG|nr:hypothetical protein DSO57_1036391 [Entomophthora muscae]